MIAYEMKYLGSKYDVFTHTKLLASKVKPMHGKDIKLI